MKVDAIAQFKEAQKHAWAHFAPLEAITTAPAARLVRFSGLRAGQRVLDVGCGTGVVAVTAARAGARVTALDLTPELLVHARENGRVAGADIEWHEGDVEDLPFDDASFDVVVSQFGHMFAPRPAVALGAMLRVLRPGGTIAFSTWPKELLVASSFALVARYSPPPPPGVAPPALWGDPAVVRERLGTAVENLVFDMARMHVPALSPAHHRARIETFAGPMRKLVETLSANDPGRLAVFRNEYDELAARYFADNVLHQDYLMTRATKI